MKSTELIISEFFSAYSEATVLEGFRLWCNGNTEQKLIEHGWDKVFPNEKPLDREYFHINNQYWVQDPKHHKKMIEEARKAQMFFSQMNEQHQPKALDHRLTCRNPNTCTGQMHPNPICSTCSEGKRGFKTKWICDKCGHLSYSKKGLSEWKVQK